MLDFFMQMGNSVWLDDIWGDVTWSLRPNGMFRIWIEEDLASPIEAALLLRRQLQELLANKKTGLGNAYVNSLPEQKQPEAQRDVQLAKLTALKATMAAFASVAEVILSVVNEGADLCLTLNDLGEGHVTAAVGFLPFIPAGALRKGGRVLLKHGDMAVEVGEDILTTLRRAQADGRLAEVIEELRQAGKLAPRKLWSLEGADRILRHTRFGKFFRDPTTGLWWSVDTAQHGGSAFKVFKETGRGLEWMHDADAFGNFITGKHKGAVGLFIPFSELFSIL